MKSYLSVLAVAALAFSGSVQAHAHLESSIPVAGSTLAAAPKSVELEFNEAVQVTALTLQVGEAKPQPIGPLPTAASRRITLPLPVMASGSYTLAWRALGEDSHVVSGKIQFKVGADARAGMKH